MVLRRWWLVLGLLVSVGVNVGVLATLAIARLSAGPAAVAGESARAAETDAGNGREVAGTDGEATGPQAGAQETGPGAGSPGAGAGEGDAEPDQAGGPEVDKESAPAPPQAPSGGSDAEPGSMAAGDDRSPERHPPPAAAGSSTRLGGSASRSPSQALAPRLERLADHLGLEGPTRARFIALQREMFATVLTSERRRLRLQVELRRELIGPSPDADRVQEMIRRQAALHAEAEAATARAILESRRLLDPDQERRYLAIVAQLGPRLREEAVRRGRENRPGARPVPGRRFPGRRPR